MQSSNMLHTVEDILSLVLMVSHDAYLSSLESDNCRAKKILIVSMNEILQTHVSSNVHSEHAPNIRLAGGQYHVQVR